MAGKTMIDGTAYDISGGKTLVNGTAYSIAGGKTLIDGTAYDISFGVDLAALFSGMTVLKVTGANGSAKTYVAINPKDYISVGGVGYFIAFKNGDLTISKVISGNSSVTYLYGSEYGEAGLSFDGSYREFKTESGYGMTLALVQFDKPESKVDAMLSEFQYVTSVGRDYSSTGNCYTSQHAANIGNFIFVAYSSYFAINLGLGNASFETIYGNREQNPSLLMVDSITNNLFVSITSGNKANVRGCSIHVVQGG